MRRGLLKLAQGAFCAIGLTVSVSFLPVQVSHAQAPSQQLTPAQIEQFKQLPRAQQQALARQYGIDLSMIERQGMGVQDMQSDPETLRPRDLSAEEMRLQEEEEQKAQEDKNKEPELKPFGYNIFAAQPTTFAPVNNAPVPGSYRIGAGDSVLIQMYGQESITHNLVVDREGRLTIPSIGPLTVAGLSYDELKALIHDQVKNRMIGMQAAVSMGELRSMQIFVLGEAHQPGAYTVSSLTTISQALLASGGISDIASLRNVQLKRAGETIVEFDLYDLLIRGDASKDRLLQPGDAVFIPSRGPLVSVDGEVVRPALYELKAGETLADAMMFAGGALASGHLSSVQIQGVRNGQRQVSTVNAATQGERALLDGDNVYVPPIAQAIDNAVVLSGAVTRPGAIEWRSGLRINNVIPSPTQYLQADADLNYGLVLRQEPSDFSLKVYQFDLASALSGDAEQNLLLQPRDEIFVFSRFQDEANRIQAGFAAEQEEQEYEQAKQALELNNALLPTRQQLAKEKLIVYTENSRQVLLESIFARLRGSGRIVRVSGEVQFPREYPMVENPSVGGYVSAAGGLRDSAYLARAEITRMVSENDGVTTDYLQFNLYDALIGNEAVKVLERDQINIFRIPDWLNTVQVTLEGEVRFPGTYDVRRGETLLNVVERAGGLTDYAFTQGAIFSREEIREQERARVAALTRELRQEMASISLTEGGVTNYGEFNQLLNDLGGAEPIGRLVLDFDKILSGDRSRDIQLSDGDRLLVPSQRNTISVIGEVQMPATYRFDDALSVVDYLELTGGLKERGDDDRIFVVRANGSVVPYSERRGWFSSTNQVSLQPGDTIVVPLNTAYTDNLELWVTGTQILYQMAVAITAVSRI